MKILIDADACPVVDICVDLAKQNKLECYILCDTAHLLERPGAETFIYEQGADSVDFALVNLVTANDIVVTQDYGLAAMCLARQARVINQNGMEFTADNIDALLLSRHTAKKIRRSGGRLKGPAKRTKLLDKAFYDKLKLLINERPPY